MQTLREYLDLVFSAYVSSENTRRIYREILNDAEEKCRDYTEQGISESSAVQKTIRDIGDIDAFLLQNHAVRIDSCSSADQTVTVFQEIRTIEVAADSADITFGPCIPSVADTEVSYDAGCTAVICHSSGHKLTVRVNAGLRSTPVPVHIQVPDCRKLKVNITLRQGTLLFVDTAMKSCRAAVGRADVLGSIESAEKLHIASEKGCCSLNIKRFVREAFIQTSARNIFLVCEDRLEKAELQAGKGSIYAETNDFKWIRSSTQTGDIHLYIHGVPTVDLDARTASGRIECSMPIRKGYRKIRCRSRRGSIAVEALHE